MRGRGCDSAAQTMADGWEIGILDMFSSVYTSTSVAISLDYNYLSNNLQTLCRHIFLSINGEISAAFVEGAQ